MASQLGSGGFDLAAIGKARDSFSWESGAARPREYSGPPWNVPYPAVRIIAANLSSFETLANALHRAAAEVAAVLPEGAEVYHQPRGTLHCTIFHPSSPASPVPLDASGLAEERLSVANVLSATNGWPAKRKRAGEGAVHRGVGAG